MRYLEPWMVIQIFEDDVVTEDEFFVKSTIYDDTEGGFDEGDDFNPFA